MSERDEVHAIFTELGGMLTTFAALARTHRARADEGLAALESDELGDLRDEAPEELRLAADDGPAPSFPATYSGGGVHLVLGWDSAGAYLAHEGGPAVELPALGLRLSPGEEAAVHLDAPPASLEVRLPDGSVLRLPRG
ncbi:MAG: hypothetical protein JNM72_26550 [Deltaproteobacteria bacterium]|nr:hypothetical protein [Deltaproteobacteria bacterium]